MVNYTGKVQIKTGLSLLAADQQIYFTYFIYLPMFKMAYDSDILMHLQKCNTHGICTCPNGEKYVTVIKQIVCQIHCHSDNLLLEQYICVRD